MIEIVALIAVLLTIANMASERRMSVTLWVGLAAGGWGLALLLRMILPFGWLLSLAGWAVVLLVFAYVRWQAIPQRERSFAGMDELTLLMEDARQHRERER